MVFIHFYLITVKRFCPVPELTKPEKLTTLQVFDKLDNQVISIPVIDEPQRNPAPPVVVINTHDHINKNQKMPLLGVMDDPEIDLTDGPVNVRVDVSSKQFYLANYKQVNLTLFLVAGPFSAILGKGSWLELGKNMRNLLNNIYYCATVELRIQMTFQCK